MNQLEILTDLSVRITNCKRCDLYKTRINAVPGIGHYDPKFLFIGESPGKSEDESGIPFYGSSGDMLYEWIEYLNLEDNEFAINNILRCRPPKNRDPKPSEIKICTSAWLIRQIDCLNPEVIITIGRISSGFILGPEFKTGIVDYGGKFYQRSRLIYPVPHPSWVLRNGGKKEIWEPYLRSLVKYVRTGEIE